MARLDMTEHLKAVLFRVGDRIAAVDKDRSLSYRDLDRLSDGLALRMIAAGAVSGERVVLAIDRSVYALVGIVAAIKAGLAYVPQEWDGLDGHAFDRIHGLERCLFLTRAAFGAALAQQGRRLLVIDAPDTDSVSGRLPETVAPDALLYTIYTSGSTGVAKGVDISRANVVHYQRALARLLNIDAPLCYAYVSSLSADLGNTCLFLSLFSGGTLHLIDDTTRRDAARFQAYLAEHHIDVLKITPSHFSSLCEAAHSDYRLTWLIFGGESLSADLARSVLQRRQASHVANHYGPTETTIGVACYPMRTLDEVPKSGSVPVGFPIGDTVFELVDAHGAILAAESNVQGELMIGGPGVGIGYCNDHALTRRAFAPLAGCHDAGRFYASGDLFLRTEEGAYLFVGRRDRQVKVRGYRIDPEAIEAVILQHCDVAAAAVLALQSGNGAHLQLVAALVPCKQAASSSDGAREAIRETLRRVLPAHQVPARVFLLDALPITGNGKMDLKALKATIDQSIERTPDSLDLDAVDAPSRLVALAHQAWIRYTGEPPASLDDNFYAAGGDSILAIQLLSTLQGDEVGVSSATFYATPTFGGLIASLHSGPAGTGTETITTAERHLAPIQRWFFEMFPDGPDHWAQTVLIDCAVPVDRSAMATAVERLLQAYPILSSAFTPKADTWLASDAEADVGDSFDVLPLGARGSVAASIQAAADALRLSAGRLFRVLLLRQPGQPDRLAMICHHLVVDGVSWRILLDDLARLYVSALQNAIRTIAVDPRSYWSWSQRLKQWAETLPAAETCEENAAPSLLADFNTGPNDEGSTAVCWLGYGEASTHALLHDLPRHMDVPIQTILLACFVRAVVGKLGRGRRCVSVDIETHGRHLFAEALDLNRAVGWFTALSPWILEAREHETLKASAERIQDGLGDLPHRGIEHGARRYLARPAAAPSPVPELCFNYLGHFRLDPDPRLAWSWSGEYPGAARAPSSARLYQLKLTGRIVNGQLAVDLSYSTHRHARRSIEALLDSMHADLADALAEVAPDAVALTPRRHFAEVSSTGLLTYMPIALRHDSPKPLARRPRAALLTGATGFIGIYLLRELLAQEDVQVHCLVRGQGDTSAQTRLWEQFRWYFPDDTIEEVRRRVVVHDGDITAENLDLDASSYAALVARIDTVFHSAADVRLLAPIDELRRVNVQGTRNVIEFCGHARAKTLHFVSTLSVAGASSTPDGSVFSEDDLHCGQHFLTPYEQSKYEAEIVVRQFMDTGGRACIHRTGSVSADAVGVFQVNIASNRVMQSICTYVMSGVVPSREEDLLLCPVDSLASALVGLAMSTPTPTGTFHLTPPRPFMHDELVPLLRKLGFNVRLDTEAAYLDALNALEASHPREATLGRLWAARVSRCVRIDAKRTHACLQSLGMAIPDIDERWFSLFLKRCIARGYLPNAEAFSL